MHILSDRVIPVTYFAAQQYRAADHYFPTTTDGLQIIEALNIPFALPPVGPLRFKPPQPNPDGSNRTRCRTVLFMSHFFLLPYRAGWTGIRNATAFGPG